MRDDPSASTFLDEGDEPRLIIDTTGTVVAANAAVEAVFGWPGADLRGESVMVLHPARLVAAYDDLRRAVAEDPGPAVIRMNVVGLRRDGTEFPALVQASRLPAEDGFAVIMRDRTPTYEKRFEAIFERAPDAHVIVDAGRVVMANPRADALLGYARHEMIGVPLGDLVPGAAPQGQEVSRTSAVRRDGSTFPAEVVLSHIETEDATLTSATIRDLTELQDVRQESERLASSFLATVSHELRTPLTSLLGYLDLLDHEIGQLRPDDRDRLERCARALRSNAEREVRLVEDLITMTVVDAGHGAPHPEFVDLSLVAETALAQFAERAAGLQVDVAVERHSDTPVVVEADPVWLGRAAECLVSNALKFTPAGGRVSLVTGVDEVEAPDDVWLEVRDTGVGLDAAEAERVFERMYRGAYAVRAHVPGTGLGLALARGIVEANGGTVRVVPAEVGARFRIVMPRAALHRAEVSLS